MAKPRAWSHNPTHSGTLTESSGFGGFTGRARVRASKCEVATDVPLQHQRTLAFKQSILECF